MTEDSVMVNQQARYLEQWSFHSKITVCAQRMIALLSSGWQQTCSNVESYPTHEQRTKLYIDHLFCSLDYLCILVIGRPVQQLTSRQPAPLLPTLNQLYQSRKYRQIVHFLIQYERHCVQLNG